MKTLNIFKYLLIGFVFTIISVNINAQNTLQKAKELQSDYDYAQAAALYQKHFAVRTPTLDEARDVANCYLMMSDTKSAGDWYARVVSYDSRTAQDVYIYANLLKSEGRYNDAILQFTHASAIDPALTASMDKQIEACNLAMEWIADPVFYNVSNATEYNSENSEFGLIRFDQEFMIASDRRETGSVYTKKDVYGWTGNPYIKLFDVKGVQNPSFHAVEGLNNQFHNGPAVFDNSSRTLIFTRTKMVKVKREKVNPDPTHWSKPLSDEEYVSRLELYTASYNDGQWGEVTPFVYNNAEEYSVGHAALSPDGKVLYFVSDMPGGYGDADIYYCEKNADGSWSIPKNAGSAINTSGKEVFPYVAEDGTMYFSSDGHQGMGGLDIFRATGSKDQWAVPENLKYPFNSPKDDFSITFESGNQSGYLASNRDGGKGGDDLYSFVFAPPTKLILVVKALERLDDGSIQPMTQANVKLEESNGNLLLNQAVNQEGLIYSEVSCNSDYIIEGHRDGYLISTAMVGTPQCTRRNDTVFAELVFDKMVINKPIVLQNIYYDYDKWFIRPDAAIELNKLVKVLSDNPTIIIELGSHTDSRGTSAYNETLSQKRAEAAVAYIVSKGIDARRITAKGYGENVPVNSCVDGVNCTEEQYQMNRRTEFKILKIE